MDAATYLKSVFEPECEFLDGELADRHTGEIPHGDAMSNVARLLQRFRQTLGIRVCPVMRIRISPTRYRVADIAVWRDDNIGTRIPTVPPFLAIEILSPEDRMVRMVPKIEEYLSIGVEWVWVIDPEEKAALIYSRKHPEGTAATATLRTENPDIEIPLESAFDRDA